MICVLTKFEVNPTMYYSLLPGCPKRDFDFSSSLHDCSKCFTLLRRKIRCSKNIGYWPVENERTGELSSPYLRFCCTTWGHFSKFNNSKVVGDIKMLLSSHKNLGKWWTFRVVFKCLCSLCSKWQHFEKKRAKIRFSALANKAVFGKVKNYPTLTKCCDQTTTATKILGIPLERQYPYLSFGT